MSTRKRIAGKQERLYVPGPDAPRYYGVEFAGDEQFAVWDAINEKTGLCYVDSLMHQSMRAFGKAHGVPFCWTYGDDALVYCCIQLGIDYKQFPHNTPKVSIDAFIEQAKVEFADWLRASNDMQRQVQRSKLVDMWTTWMEKECKRNDCPRNYHSSCSEHYAECDYDELAQLIVADNERRRKLLADIDARPRGKSIKIANDAFARIKASLDGGTKRA